MRENLIKFCLVVLLGVNCYCHNQNTDVYRREKILNPNGNKILTFSKTDSVQDTNILGIGALVWKGKENEDFSIFYDTLKLPKRFVLKDLVKDTLIEPFAYHPDYYLLVFKCIEYSGGFYKILLKKDKNQIGYIKKEDKRFKFESWAEHILKIYSIGVDKDSSIMSEPNYSSSRVNINLEDQLIEKPIKVEGEWLKIIFKNESNVETKGWVKWKGKNDLLVEFFYFN